MSKKLFIDIHYSFLRQPIKMALSYKLGDKITFVSSDEEADLILTTTDQHYASNTPILYLTDAVETMATHITAVDISPIPTSDRDMQLLVERVGRLV